MHRIRFQGFYLSTVFCITTYIYPQTHTYERYKVYIKSTESPRVLSVMLYSKILYSFVNSLYFLILVKYYGFSESSKLYKVPPVVSPKLANSSSKFTTLTFSPLSPP